MKKVIRRTTFLIFDFLIFNYSESFSVSFCIFMVIVILSPTFGMNCSVRIFYEIWKIYFYFTKYVGWPRTRGSRFQVPRAEVCQPSFTDGMTDVIPILSNLNVSITDFLRERKCIFWKSMAILFYAVTLQNYAVKWWIPSNLTVRHCYEVAAISH